MLVACYSLIHHSFSLRYGVCGSMPVSLHYALSTMQFPVVVPVHWTPSAFPPYGSVLACAVPAVFYTPARGSESRRYPLLPVAWIPRLASFPQFLTIRYPTLVQSLPVCLRCSQDSTVPACIGPLRPVCNPGCRNGSDTLATLGFSAVGFCPSFRCPCGVLCA